MRRTIISGIKEWFLRLSRHNENDVMQETESVMLEVGMPPTDDDLRLDLDEAGAFDVEDKIGEVNTENAINTLSAECDEENNDSAKFDDIEPIVPLEMMPQKDVVNIERRTDNQESAGQDNVEQEKEKSTSEKMVNVPKLVSLTVNSIKYYDKLRSQMPTEDLKKILDDVCRNLIDNLILSGCTPINEESGFFDMSRHRVEPFQMIDDGTPFFKLTRKGVVFQNEVKLLAIVEL